MIKVFDKNGNELEPTYPKRAQGLVKKGRARFIDECTIVLCETTEKTEACPPSDRYSEDMNMFDNNNFNSINSYFGEILDTKVEAKSVCGSLVGSVIGGGASKNAILPAFDGRVDTTASLSKNRGEAVDYWLGLKMYEPTAVKTVMVATTYRKQHRIYGSFFQGSFNGQLWTTLCEFTEADFIEYADSDAEYYVKHIDCPVDYVYYRFFNYDDKGGNIASLLLFGEDEKASTIEAYHGEISLTGVRNHSRCGSLEGMIIGAGGKTEADYFGAFDGRGDTVSEFGVNPGNRVYYWFGLKADEPTALSHITLGTPKGKRRHVIRNSYFQGSTDGVNWTTLAYFGDEDYLTYLNDTDHAYYTKTIADEEAYTYFRYFNSEGVGVNCLAELYLYGKGETLSDLNTYRGEITYTGVRSVSLFGSVRGEVIGAGAESKFEYIGAFDGNIGTQTNLPMNLGEGVYHWFGIKTDEPVSLEGVSVATQNGDRRHAIRGSYFQGSNDGVNWTTLAMFTADDYLNYNSSGSRYYTKEIADPTPYTYFRYFNYNDGGANRLAQLLLYTAENISGIQYLGTSAAGEQSSVRVNVNVPKVGNTPKIPTENGVPKRVNGVMWKYVDGQITHIGESLQSRERDLTNLFLSGGCTAEQYQERMITLRSVADCRVEELQRMLHDAAADTEEESCGGTQTLDRDQSQKAYIKEQVNEIKRSLEGRFDDFDDLECMIDEIREEAESVRDEMEGMIGDLKGELTEALNEALGEIRSLLE
ncbi:MAG: hypothetical protein E7638_01720 [Ruminococcaceae bacterium]|nr:hypothetical protein [Oscillospiraceae bacterium]